MKPIPAGVAVLGLLWGCGEEERPPLEPMQVAQVRGTVYSFVRAVTVEGGCRSAEEARVAESPDALTVTILGRNPPAGTGCTADVKVRCVELELPRPPGERALRAADPVQERATGVGAALTGDCRRIPVRSG